MDLAAIRDYCLSLPAVTEDVKWGNDLCFLVGNKMFCITGFQPDSALTFKATPESFDELTAREGIVPAPYLGRAKWVAVTGRDVLPESELKNYIRQSYELVAAGLTRKQRSEIGL